MHFLDWYHAKYSLKIYKEYSHNGYVFRYFG